MVIDTSAVIAILQDELDAPAYAEAIRDAPLRLLSSVNLVEAAMVIEARNQEPGGRELDLLLHRSHIDVVPFTLEQAETARAAWRRYGKGNHPAGLNFCDCCAYALARTSGEPLLFKGNDFSQTDVASALE